MSESRVTALLARASLTMLADTLSTAVFAVEPFSAVHADTRARALLAVVGLAAMVAEACRAIAWHLQLEVRKRRATVQDTTFEPSIRN